jgi:hypothetical protein
MEIYINQYTFHIEVTDYTKGYPAKTWGAPENCYEGTDDELEWSCQFVEEYFEDGEVKILLAGQFESIVEEYAELIEEKLLAEIEEMRDDDFDDDNPTYWGE